jgi:hypothetical protein
MLLSPLPNVLSPAMYVRAFHAYSRALAPVAARVPLIGPAVANPVVDANWITSLLRSSHHRLGIVSAHRYPYSGCASRKSLSYPTIGRVLSELATAGMAQSLRPAVMLAHRAGLPFQMTELNSVTCGGLAGVSDSFATALWAPDALFELMRVGVAGVDIHVRARAINAAFVLTRQGLIARPLLYGLVLFTRTLGEDPRLVDLGLRADPRLHLKAWAVRVRGGGLHVLLINKGHRAAAVDVRVRGVGPAAAEQLLAPSAAARSGVTLNGQQLGPGGRWQGLPATQTVAARRRGYELTVSPTSAVLLRLRLR